MEERNFHQLNNNSYFVQRTNSGILGNTIEEKTRAILGWTDSNSGYLNPTDDRSSNFLQRRCSDGSSSGPEKTKKRRPSCGRSNYPYDLFTCSNRSNEPFSRSATIRKCSSSSVNSLSSTTNEFSSLILSHELTPPPSPILRNQLSNGPAIASLSRSAMPQPPPYGQQQQQQQQQQCSLQTPGHHLHHFKPSLAELQLPISPVSPPPPAATTVVNPTTSAHFDDEASTTAGTNCRPGASAAEIFERLRTQMPYLSTEQSKFRLLLQTVANVIELETKLAQLHEETRSLSNILQEKRLMQQFQHQASKTTENLYVENNNGHSNSTCADQAWSGSLSTDFAAASFAVDPIPGPPAANFEDVPDDLQEIDVTAFRWLVSENSRDLDCNFKNARSSSSSYSEEDHCSNSIWREYYADVSKNNQPSAYASDSVNDFLSIGEFERANGTATTNSSNISNPLVVDTIS